MFPSKGRPWAGGINRKEPLARNLVGCWPIWEGAGNIVQNLINPHYNGTLTDGPTWVGTSLGTALNIANADEEYVNLNNNLELTQEFSFAMVGQPSSTAATQYLFAANQNGGHAGRVLSDGTLQYVDSGVAVEAATSAGFVPTNRMSLFGMSRRWESGTTYPIEFFSDTATTTVSGGALTNNNTFVTYLFRDELGAGGRPFDGPVAIVYFWNTYYSAELIKRHLTPDPFRLIRPPNRTDIWQTAVSTTGTNLVRLGRGFNRGHTSGFTRGFA